MWFFAASGLMRRLHLGSRRVARADKGWDEQHRRDDEANLQEGDMRIGRASSGMTQAIAIGLAHRAAGADPGMPLAASARASQLEPRVVPPMPEPRDTAGTSPVAIACTA